ncbi:MAG: MerR family transcriptional regulator [Actinomycetota bacterium]
MAWSTRELADLAGTTVNTVRHYHRLGLLTEPDRSVNGYKHYGVAHLVRLLRIRRLAALGVPLADMAVVAQGGDETPTALQAVDARLAEQIADLQRARADIAAILREGAPADGVRGFESVASRLSEADRSILHISSRLYDQEAIEDLRRMTEAEPSAADKEFDALPADADEATRERVAEGLAPSLAQQLDEYPGLTDPALHAAQSERVTRETFIEAVVELYNPAQIDVLTRATRIAHARRGSAAAGEPQLAEEGDEVR